MAKAASKSATIEENFKSLEEIISKLEEGTLTLDESFKLYNEGVKIVKNCNSQLDKVEKQIVIINGSGDEDEL